MSDADASIVAARAEVERTRARLMATARELQERLSPQTLARDIWEGAKDKGAGLAEEAVDAVRKRPMVAGGVIAALALFLGRDPIMDYASKLMNGKDEPAKPAKRAARATKPKKSSKPSANGECRMSVKQTAETAREKAIEAYDSARQTAASAGRKAGDGIDEAPLIALAGGLAIGALIAALLPKTAKETRAARRSRRAADRIPRATRPTRPRKRARPGSRNWA